MFGVTAQWDQPKYVVLIGASLCPTESLWWSRLLELVRMDVLVRQQSLAAAARNFCRTTRDTRTVSFAISFALPVQVPRRSRGGFYVYWPLRSKNGRNIQPQAPGLSRTHGSAVSRCGTDSG
eukprot:1835768-Prymnesium_polylepis.1